MLRSLEFLMWLRFPMAMSLRCQMVTVSSGGRYHLASFPRNRHTSRLVGSFAANSAAVILTVADDTDLICRSFSDIDTDEYVSFEIKIDYGLIRIPIAGINKIKTAVGILMCSFIIRLGEFQSCA